MANILTVNNTFFDLDADGKVDLAEVAETLTGVTAAPNNSFYGKNNTGDVGFYTVTSSTPVTDFLSLTDTPSSYSNSSGKLVTVKLDGSGLEFSEVAANIDNRYMTKGVYDTTNNGIVDNSESLAGQTPQYYLSRTNHTGSQPITTLSQSGASTGQVIRWNGSAWAPAIGGTGDMLISTYDSNSDGIVNLADNVNGISSANSYTYYGKNAAGSIGFHSLSTVAGSGDMNKGIYDNNDNGVVDNSERLANQLPTYYLERANHTGTIPSSVISDFNESLEDRVSSFISTNSSISKSYDDTNNLLSFAVVQNTTIQKIEISNNGTLVGNRKGVNFIPGTNTSLDINDNSGNDRIDITISNTGSAGVSLNNFNTYTRAQVVQTVSLTESATIATDASLSNSFKVTLTANRILGNPTNLVEGGTYNWLITQDSTGGRVLTLSSLFILSTGSVFASTANGKSVLSCAFVAGFLYCSISNF